MNRKIRRTRDMLLRQKEGGQRRAFATGQWPPWERKEVAFGEVGPGWCAEIHTAYQNGVLAVLHRTVQTEWGPVEHLAIRNATNTDVPWVVKQRVKDEIIGPERIGLDVMPKASDLIDDANMFHVWVMPPDFALPFGLHNGGKGG